MRPSTAGEKSPRPRILDLKRPHRPRPVFTSKIMTVLRLSWVFDLHRMPFPASISPTTAKPKGLLPDCSPFWKTHSWQFSFLAHEWLCVIDKDFPLLRYD